jgi:hypothetical protein
MRRRDLLLLDGLDHSGSGMRSSGRGFCTIAHPLISSQCLVVSLAEASRRRRREAGENPVTPNFCKFLFGGNVKYQWVIAEKIWKSDFRGASHGLRLVVLIGFCGRKDGMSRN